MPVAVDAYAAARSHSRASASQGRPRVFLAETEHIDCDYKTSIASRSGIRIC